MNRRTSVSRRDLRSVDLPYFQTFFGPQLRPNAKMPLEAHRACGILLNQVLIAIEQHHAAREHIKYALGTLDDWAMREYDLDELDMATLDSLYMRAALPSSIEKPDAHGLLTKLDLVKQILRYHYPHGKALRNFSRHLALAKASIAKSRCS